MTPTGSEPLFASTVPGRVSHQKEIGQRRYASVRIFTGLATWSSGSSTRSSTVGVWQHATTSSRPTTSHSSSLHPYGCGCALMSPRPKMPQLTPLAYRRDRLIPMHGGLRFRRNGAEVLCVFDYRSCIERRFYLPVARGNDLPSHTPFLGPAMALYNNAAREIIPLVTLVCSRHKLCII
jgi:hypothetical protein